jgi:hypothetical protein
VKMANSLARSAGLAALLAVGVFSVSCRIAEPVSAENSAHVVVAMVSAAERSRQLTTGTYGDIEELIRAGYLDRQKLEFFKRRAAQFQFSLTTDPERTGFEFVARPRNTDEGYAFRVKNSGPINEYRVGAESGH